jgi:single-strand DNA-binding protein
MYHTIIIVGNLGRDPEMRYTPNGTPVTSFNVASNRQYTNSQGERIKETIWFRVSAWNKLAETCNNFLKKGSKVLVEGRLVPDMSTGGPRTYTRNDGTTGASFEVNANTVRFMDSKSDSSQGPGDDFGDMGGDDDEIPF